MAHVDQLILGGGITGVAFAYYSDRSSVILEQESEIGGKLKTIRRNGFQWDYAGHFLHFTDRGVEADIRDVVGEEFLEINKQSHILYDGNLIDYPFQKNIHQLPKSDFIECLYDLYFKPDSGENFKQALISKCGEAICEKFLFPYNKKLYDCDLNSLGPETMGRFFPESSFESVLENFVTQRDESYNANFLYPESGIDSVVKGFADAAKSTQIHLNSEAINIDLAEQTVTTDSETYRYEDLITTIPLTDFLKLTNITCDSPLAGNKVLVFNIGFDQSSPINSHWVYVPDMGINFHRVGFYDNIFDEDKMSIYLEIGFKQNRKIDISAEMNSALDSLSELDIIRDHDILATHSVVMDPAYCYMNQDTVAFVDKMETLLQQRDVHLLGRYSEWKYCSVEDNVRDAKQLAAELNS